MNPSNIPTKSRSRMDSFRHAAGGLKYAFRTQANFRILLAISTLVIVLIVLLQLDSIRTVCLTGCILLTLSMELINTSIEVAIDLASPRIHPLAKTAKDVSAAAVLVVSIGSALIGIVVLWHPIVQTFHSLFVPNP